MKKPLIIIIAVVAVLAIAAAVFFIFIMPNLGGEEGEAPVVTSIYTPGDYFVTNVKDTLAMVKATIVLEVNKPADDQEFHDFLLANNHIIRQTIIFVLNDKTEAELRAQTAREILTREIVEKCNAALGIDNITTIYFNDYVVQ